MMVAFVDEHRAAYGAEPIGDMPLAEMELAYYRQAGEWAIAV
jgi:hypothetical protein